MKTMSGLTPLQISARFNHCSKFARGFSLIEITITIGILAVVMAAMLSIFSQGQRYLRKNRLTTTANFLMQGKLEELCITNPNLFSNPDSYDEARAAVSGFTDFERQVDVTCPYLGDSGLTHIAVTVWWQGETGERWRAIETVKANY